MVVFELVYIPSRLAQGVVIEAPPVTILVPFLIGILFVLVYYRTGNLFATIGLYMLVSGSVLIVNAGAIVALPILLVLLVVLLT